MKLIFKSIKLVSICRNMYFLKNLLIHKVAASVENAKIIDAIEIDCLIDVGANVGQFSTLCYHYKKNIKIIAFEPIASCYKKLKEILSNNKNIFLFNCALGNRSGFEYLVANKG